MIKVRVKDNSRRAKKRVQKKAVEGMAAAVKFLERKFKRELTDPYSKVVGETDERNANGRVGFDKAGHYEDSGYRKNAILAKILWRSIRGLNRAYRRKAKKK